MVKAAEQRTSLMGILAVLFVVVLALNVLFVGFSIRSTSISRNIYEDWIEKGLRGDENTAGTNKGTSVPEIEAPLEDNGNVESKEPNEVSIGKNGNVESKEPNEVSIGQAEENSENVESTRPYEGSDNQVEPDILSTQVSNSAGWGINSVTSDIGVYSDSVCTIACTNVDLGTIFPGRSIMNTVYVKNNGDNDLVLSLWTTNWNPEVANGPIVLSWNLEGTILSANEIKTAILTLSVSTSIQGITTFSFDTAISGY